MTTVMTSNIQILEAILKRELQSEQTEEINNLPALNSFNKSDKDRIFILDEDETPNMIGYLNPDMDSSILNDATLIWDSLKVKIFKLN
jgi:hypothetical protein|nr:MAG TPA: hypothetical protein [Caudoviricetes sp.]